MNGAASGAWRRAWQDLGVRLRAGASVPAPAMPHVRGNVSVDRVLGLFVIASLPAAAIGIWASGRIALESAAGGLTGWRAGAIAALGLPAGGGHVLTEIVAGLSFALPLLAVSYVVAVAWETVFAALRGRPTDPGWIMSGWLFAMLLPADTPPWQAALGLSFGLVLGCHVFGGTGRYIASPAILGALYLRLAYPVDSGPPTWQAAFGADGAGWWSAAVAGGPAGLGTASAVACVLGAGLLVASRVASLRTLLGAVVGLALGSAVAAAFGDTLPFHWHAVLGSVAFCWAFTLTDPTTLPLTQAGRWAHGALFGVLVIAIREGDPTRPEGSLTAVLVAALCVPLIDYVALRWYRARSGGRMEIAT